MDLVNGNEVIIGGSRETHPEAVQLIFGPFCWYTFLRVSCISEAMHTSLRCILTPRVSMIFCNIISDLVGKNYVHNPLCLFQS